MSDVVQIKDWRTSAATGAAYEKLLGSIGTEDFGTNVRDSVMSMTAGARRIYLFEATSREESSLQYFFGEPGLVELFPAYRKWYLPLDPVCDAYHAAPACSDVAMVRVQPSDIDSPGFRRRIFDTPGIIERMSVIQRGADAWRVMSVARHASDGRFSDNEVSSLISLACLVLPMLPVNRARRRTVVAPSVSEIEERFAKQYPCLTARERQVCARAAAGMTVEATAVDLGIAKTSVLTYRQRAYQRLGVTSPIELCTLVTH